MSAKFQVATSSQPRSGGPSEAQVKLLRESFSRIVPQSQIAALVFYRNLFTLDPLLRAMFHTDIEIQGRKLMEALSFTVASLEQPEKLCPALEAMGRRHATYGALDQHYETVTNALILTLQEIMTRDFNCEMEDAWRSAMSFISDVMKRGAAQMNALKS